MMTGLSLSLCVRDIAEGKILENDVERIIAGTAFETDDEFEDVINMYNKSYWREYPEAQNIARRLKEAGKIYQPRIFGGNPPNVSHSRWM